MRNAWKLGTGLILGIFSPLFSLHSIASMPGYTSVNGLELGSRDAPIVYTAKQFAVSSRQQKNSGTHIQTTTPIANNQKNNALQLKWGMYSFGSGIGASGFYLADLDGDNQQELVMGGGQGFGSNTVINVLKKSGSGYAISQQLSLPGNLAIKGILGFYNQSTDNHELFVTSNSGGIYQFNLTAGRLASVLSEIGDTTTLLTGDVDGDQVAELLVVGNSQTRAYDLYSHSLKYTYAFGSNGAAYGHFSSPASNELAFTNGSVYRLQGNSSTLVWNYSSGFGAKILASDTNGDGSDEVVGAESWYKISAFDVKNKAILWSKNAGLDIATIAAFDTNKDGINEIFYGDGQWGSIYQLNSANGAEISSIPNPEHGVTNIIVTDIDKDDALEIIWGAGYSSTGPDYLYISDLVSKQNEWRSSDVSGPFYAIKIADVDNDGKMELVGISNESNSGYGDGVLYVFDAVTHALKWSSEGSNLFGGHAWTGIRALDVGDVDGDGKNEIVVGTDRLYDGIIYVINGATKALKYSKIYDSGSPITSVKIIDINLDGKNDIVAANGVEHTGSPGTMVYVLNGNNGDIINKSSSLMFDWAGTKQLDVFDTNGDAIADINVIVNNSAYTYDTTKSIFQQIGTANYTAIAHGIVDNNQRVILGGADGWLSYRDSTSVVAITKVCDSSVSALTNHSSTQLLLICDSTFGLFDLSSRSFIWQQMTSVNPKAITSFKGTTSDQFLLGGDNLSLYEGGASASNLLAADSSISTSFKKPVSAKLTALGKTDAGNFIVVKAPLHGTLAFSNRPQGDFTFTPKGDFIGSDSFSFIVLENGVESNTANVNITITNSNPVSVSQTFSTSWSKSLSSQIKASDDDNDELTFKILSQPARGTLTLVDVHSGAFTYLPEGKSVEPVSFTYEVTDGMAKTNPVSAVVNFTNAKPVAQASTVSGSYNASSSGILKATDGDADSLTYRVIENVTSGSLSVDAVTGLYTYQPSGDKAYSAIFKFVANDGVADSEPQLVTIKIEGKAKSGGGGGSPSLLLLIGLLLITLVYQQSANLKPE